MGALDLITKAAKKAGPFFSRVDEVLEGLKREKGTPEEFLREIEKQPGVKKAEIEERGLKKALEARAKTPEAKKPVTKEVMRKILQENPPPKIKEEVRGGNELLEALDEKAREIIGDPYASFDDLTGRDREFARASVDRDFGYEAETKFEQWRTPGGENYREILLKLPQRGLNEAQQRNLMLYESSLRRGEELDPWHQKQYQALKQQEAAASQDYRGPHWEGTPNVLAHIRVQDFKTPEGKKVLLVDEIQSDWHQEGRKQGYFSGDRPKIGGQIRQEPDGSYSVVWADGVVNKGHDMQSAQRAIEKGKVTREGVPDAPFKKNWHELAMKRVLDYAAENGYDTVAITPGAEQAKRYDLSKHIDKINYDKFDSGQNELKAWDKNGKLVLQKYGPTQDEVADHIGKEAAEKLFSVTPKDNHIGGQRYSLIGEDLQVGGEGMKGFYDKILPDYLNTFGKQYGASVGQMQIKNYGYQDGQFAMEIPDSFSAQKWASEAPGREIRGGGEQYHSFDITPQLREQVKSKGLPMYSRIGMGPEGLAAGTGAATIGATQQPQQPEQQVQNPVHFTENPDEMLLDLMQRN